MTVHPAPIPAGAGQLPGAPTAGTPAALAARLRTLLEAGPAAPAKGATKADQDAAARAYTEEVDRLRHEIAEAFAEGCGWRPTTAPLAVKELAARAPAGGRWHRPAREWLGTLFAPTFFRDEARRAIAMVAHPLAEQVERDRAEIEAWAAERELVVTFPDLPSWHDPIRSVVAVFEPAAPLEAQAARPLPELGFRPAPASGPASVPAEPRTMRPVAPVDLDGAVPRDLESEEDPDFDVVDPATLLIDEGYQRGLTPKSLALIRRIVENWSWSKFKVPTCVRVDGQLHVLDGQHSAIAAASHPGVGAIPVLIAKLPGAADRAAAFVSHATERLPTTIVQVHHAAVLAGDEDAVTIDRVCRAAGVDLVAFPPPRSAYRPRQTIALNAIRRLVDRRGAMRARQVLEALAAADLAPIAADHIRAAEVLLCDPDLSGELDAYRVAAGMRSLAARGFAEARTLAATKNLTLWRAMVALVLKGARARPRGGGQGERRRGPAEVEETAA